MDTGSLESTDTGYKEVELSFMWVSWNASMDLCLGLGEEPSERFWAVTKEQSAMGDIAVGICCWLPDQEEQVHEAPLVR